MISNIITGLLSLVYILGTILTVFALIYIPFTVAKKLPYIKKHLEIKKHKKQRLFDNDEQRKRIGIIAKNIKQKQGNTAFKIFRNLCIITWFNDKLVKELKLTEDKNATLNHLLFLGEENFSYPSMIQHTVWYADVDFKISYDLIRNSMPDDMLKYMQERYEKIIK